MITDTLHLVLTGHWYDETIKAVDPKRTEYRAITPRWMRLIYERRDTLKKVRFARAYTSTMMTFAVTKIDIGPCPIPGWSGNFYRIHFTDLPKFEHPCTECGGDAYIGFTNWTGPEGQIIGKKERLCTRCAKGREI